MVLYKLTLYLADCLFMHRYIFLGDQLLRFVFVYLLVFLYFFCKLAAKC